MPGSAAVGGGERSREAKVKGRQRGIPGAARLSAERPRCRAATAALPPGRPCPGRAAPAMLCCLPGVACVPALLVSWSSAAFIISYVMAVLAGHVEPLVPYIR